MRAGASAASEWQSLGDTDDAFFRMVAVPCSGGKNDGGRGGMGDDDANAVIPDFDSCARIAVAANGGPVALLHADRLVVATQSAAENPRGQPAEQLLLSAPWNHGGADRVAAFGWTGASTLACVLDDGRAVCYSSFQQDPLVQPVLPRAEQARGTRVVRAIVWAGGVVALTDAYDVYHHQAALDGQWLRAPSWSQTSENEIAWMLEECAAIEAAADRLLSSLPDTGALGEALTTFRANRAETMHLSAVAADYGRCSEVLSRLAEGAYAAGDDDAIATVQELIDGRLATEQAAIGEFIAVGRD